MTWLNTFVLRLKLCPFAYRPLLTHRPTEFSYHGYTGSSHTTLIDLIATHVAALAALPESSRHTSLIVLEPPYPTDLADFHTFHAFITDHINTLPAIESGLIQIAPFHPQFEFADASTTASTASHYVNRSPFPMFHILREVEVTAAVDKFNAAASGGEEIWARNMALMDEFTEEEVERAARGEMTELPGGVQEFLKEEKKRDAMTFHN